MRTSPATLAAAALVAVEGLAILVLAVVQIFAIVSGDTAELSSAIALLVLTIIMGGGVLAFAYGILRSENWGRSGGIVTQVLIAAIGLGAATGMYAHPMMAFAIAAPAILTLILIVVAARKNPAEHAQPDTDADTDTAAE